MKTSTEYRNPHRPLPVALFNRAGRMARRLGLDDALDVGRLVATACRRTGLSDFGDDWFLEPLDVLVRSINSEAQLTPLGVTIQRSRLVSALSTRLRLEHLLGRHPEILDIQLGKIIVIAGLQRTATTTLHRLIAAHPDVRALRSWEALSPVPLPGERRGHPRRRVRQAKLAAAVMRYLAPDFLAVHPVDYDAPEEDVLLLDLSFMSQAPEAMMHVPAYARWLEEQDHTKGYEHLLTMLKLLHWQRPGGCWVLKTPHHMEYLDALLAVFPDACIVQTHRDPKTSVASFCSMVAHARGMLSDHVDPEAIGAHWLRKTRRMIERSTSVRRAAGDGVFVDVSYYDLIADPLGELRRICRVTGIEFNQAAEDAAKAVSRRNVKNRHGRHVYSLAGFGLDGETVDECCDRYRRTHAIPDEAGMRRQAHD